MSGADWALILLLLAALGVFAMVPLLLVWAAAAALPVAGQVLCTVAQVRVRQWHEDRARQLELAADPAAAAMPWANLRMVAFAYDQHAAELRDEAFDLAAAGDLDAAADREQVADRWAAAATDARAQAQAWTPPHLQ